MSAGKQRSFWKGESLDPHLEAYFRPLCTPPQNNEIPKIKTEITDHVAEINDALRYNEFLDIDTAQRLANALLILLDQIEDFSQQQQTLIVGAARYFVHPHDADPDTGSILGLDDDTAVLNYVLDQIDKPELKIKL